MADGVGNSYGVQLATKLQMLLDQPTSDLASKLVNKDYAGEFFKIGDTVQICKVDPKSVNVEVGTSYSLNNGVESRTGVAGTIPASPAQSGADDFLPVRELNFSATELRIDKTAKYAFYVSEINNVEGKWNYESSGLDLAAQRIKKEHNLEVAQAIVDDAVAGLQTSASGTHVMTIGTPVAPISLTAATAGDDLYKKVFTKLFAKLHNKGAITADGKWTAGSNPQEAKRMAANIYVPMAGYNEFLASKYFTERSTTAADDKVETGNISKILGMDLGIEPSLDPTDADTARKITIGSVNGASADENCFVVIAGTGNTVTMANKALPPRKFESHTRYGAEYHGLEIYGLKVFNPECAVVAFVKIA